MLGHGGKGARPSKVILPDSLGLDALNIALHAHVPNGAVGSHEPIFPRDNGAFLIVQLPLPAPPPPPPTSSPHPEVEKAYTHQQATISNMTRSKTRQSPALARALPFQ
jgi:hypothetical protein